MKFHISVCVWLFESVRVNGIFANFTSINLRVSEAVVKYVFFFPHILESLVGILAKSTSEIKVPEAPVSRSPKLSLGFKFRFPNLQLIKGKRLSVPYDGKKASLQLISAKSRSSTVSLHLCINLLILFISSWPASLQLANFGLGMLPSELFES